MGKIIHHETKRLLTNISQIILTISLDTGMKINNTFDLTDFLIASAITVTHHHVFMMYMIKKQKKEKKSE